MFIISIPVFRNIMFSVKRYKFKNYNPYTQTSTHIYLFISWFICVFIALYVYLLLYTYIYCFVCCFIHLFLYWFIDALIYMFIYVLVSWLMSLLVYWCIALCLDVLIYLCVCLCICAFMYWCVDGFMYLCICVNPQMCIYGFIVLCNCVNPLASLSFPFVIYCYIHMSLFARSFRPHRQDAILSFHSSLCNVAMRHKRVIVARQIIHAQYTLLAHPATIIQICISQYLRGLWFRRQPIKRVCYQHWWGRGVCQHHIAQLHSL